MPVLISPAPDLSHKWSVSLISQYLVSLVHSNYHVKLNCTILPCGGLIQLILMKLFCLCCQVIKLSYSENQRERAWLIGMLSSYIRFQSPDTQLCSLFVFYIVFCLTPLKSKIRVTEELLHFKVKKRSHPKQHELCSRSERASRIGYVYLYVCLHHLFVLSSVHLFTSSSIHPFIHS